jgi:hypothetical protein
MVKFPHLFGGVAQQARASTSQLTVTIMLLSTHSSTLASGPEMKHKMSSFAFKISMLVDFIWFRLNYITGRLGEELFWLVLVIPIVQKHWTVTQFFEAMHLN